MTDFEARVLDAVREHPGSTSLELVAVVYPGTERSRRKTNKRATIIAALSRLVRVHGAVRPETDPVGANRYFPIEEATT